MNFLTPACDVFASYCSVYKARIDDFHLGSEPFFRFYHEGGAYVTFCHLTTIEEMLRAEKKMNTKKIEDIKISWN